MHIKIKHQTRGQVTGLLVWNLDAGASAFYSFINVNCQGILVRRKPQKRTLDFPLILLTQIYRCWVMWDRKLAIAVIPSILALIPLGKLAKVAANCIKLANSS